MACNCADPVRPPNGWCPKHGYVFHFVWGVEPEPEPEPHTGGSAASEEKP